MKNSRFTLLIILISCFFYACGQNANNTDKTTTPSEEANSKKAIETNSDPDKEKSSSVGNIPIYDFKSFEPLLHINNDTCYVVNFWATWCKPCVAELPYFEELRTKYANKKVKVLLVSLDFSNQVEKKLIPFLEKRQLKSEVVVLDDPDANGWIDKVNPKWSGAIPATVIYQGEKRAFLEQSFETFHELDEFFLSVFK